MKKGILCGLVLFAGPSSQAFASAGYAYDGFEFILVFAGLMFLLAGFLRGIDYLNKNGRVLLHRVKAFIRKKVAKNTLPTHSSEGGEVKSAICDNQTFGYLSIP